MLNDVGHCWFQLGDGCSRCPPMHMHVYCEEGRIAAGDPVVNEKIVGDNAMEKAYFTGDWGGVEAGAHIGSLLVVSRFSSISMVEVLSHI